jgi:hypothetical protein
VLHGEAVAGEGVGWVELKNLFESGKLVHRLIVVSRQSSGLNPITLIGPMKRHLRRSEIWRGGLARYRSAYFGVSIRGRPLFRSWGFRMKR